MKNLIFFCFFFINANSYAQIKFGSTNNSDFFNSNNDEKKIIKKIISSDTILFLKSPVEKGRISSGYGKRFHPVLKINKNHNGIDFAAPYGSKVKATAGGIVEKEGYSKFNGNFVIIRHNKSYSTQYLHLSEIKVIKGLEIKKGDIIGLVGSSGLSSGPHVCYRFIKDGKEIDPLSIKKIINNSPSDDKSEFKSFINDFF